MTQKRLLLILSLLLSQLVMPSYAATGKDLAINRDMSKIGRSMTDLLPIIVNEKRFRMPSNQERISKDLDELIELFAKVGPHFDTKSVTYRVSYGVMLKHLQETRTAYMNHNQAYSQSMLRELVSICTSCHTQDDQRRTLFLGATRNTFDDDYHYAEFNYLSRNYSVAVEYYNRYLQPPVKEISDEQALDSLRNMLIMQVQIDQDPGLALRTLAPYDTSTKLSDYSRKTVHEWIDGLKQLKAHPLPSKKKITFKAMEALINQHLGSLQEPGNSTIPDKPKQVIYIALRGLIYHLLAQHPSEAQTPQLLYWLAIVDRSTRNSFYYSLSDLYLKECILKYSHDPIAKRCFDEYEDYMQFSYSGSQGTEIPEDVQREIEQLRTTVYGHDSTLEKK